ncbi:MAG: integrase arm-type DNA-binding domain-containing protein [Gammaproteobacteria bacterium]|nr:integrase arm-type DNA-binding domain-containing protein [Gammaproteobacteria bacterium]
MPLTDTAIRNAKPGPKPVRLFDGGGLYLEISPAGGKLWRLKYRIDGKEKRLALGVYPDVSLAEARDRRSDARKLLAAGIDPSVQRKAEKAARTAEVTDSFEAVAREWFARHLGSKAPGHRDKVVRRLERDVFPYLGARPVGDIKAPEILAVVRRIEGRALETAHRAVQNIGQVIRYAVATGRAEIDPTPSLRGALAPWKPEHMAAPTDPAQVGEILRMQDAFKGGPVVGAALRLLPLLFVRPGELRTMRWEQIDIEAKEWRYTTSKTKTEHLVPLSRQAVAILAELRPLTDHRPGGWVFPGGRSPKSPMSNMAINAAYRRLGIDTRTELTGHGWRATARTLLHERLGFDPVVIEHQLAHRVPDALGRAYNRTRFLDERRSMMQAWADYLDLTRAQKP